LHLYGLGESLINPLFPEMLAKLDFSVICNQSIISTNASFLKGKNAQAIINSNIDYIKISIYSVIQKRHENITGSKIDINSIYENIAAFRKMRDESKTKKPYIYIKMIDTFTGENDVFLSMYNDIGDEVGLEQPFNWPGQNSIKAAYETAGNAEIVQNHYKHSLSSEKKVCEFPFFNLNIINNGDITVCCQDPLGNLIMGNINNSSLYQIWNGDTFNKLRFNFLNRKMNLYEPCKNCDSFRRPSPTLSSNIDSMTPNEFMNRLGKKGYVL
jgi:radical SAM protein with 4Fe4S-binding SPASM domain